MTHATEDLIIQEELPHSSLNHMEGRKPAGFWIRAAAYLLDSMILFVPLLILKILQAGAVFWARTSEAFMPNMIEGVLSTILPLLVAAYFIVLEASPLQATLGKRVLGLKVCKEDGSAISIGQSMGRYFSKILSSIFFVGYIMVGVREDKRGLHDLLPNTYVNQK